MPLPRPAFRRLLAGAALVVVLAIVLYAGLGPHPVPQGFHEEDKLYHLIGFAALAACTRLTFPRAAWWWQVIGVLALGGGIELAQTFQPERVGSVWDFLFDGVGVAAGWLLLQMPTLRAWGAP